MRRTLLNFFLYTHDPERVPRLLRRGATLGMLAMVLMSFLAANMQALLWQSSPWLVSTVLPAVVVDLTNTERAQEATFPLHRSSVLDEAASLKAQHMAAGGYFSHYSPDGVSPWYWFDQVGYVYAHAGENLAIHFSDSGEVMEAWMKSPLHRANIVNSNYTEIGVGTAKGVFEGYETVYVVQMFASPGVRPLPVQVSIVPPEMATTTTLAIANPPTGEISQTASTTVAFYSASSSAQVAGLEAVTTPAVLIESIPGEESGVATSGDFFVEEASVIFKLEPAAAGKNPEPLYLETIATSSGYSLQIQAPGEASGTTKTAILSSLATQPSKMLQIMYMILSSIVGGMLVLAILLSTRSGRPWQIIRSLALLTLMSGLVSLHLYLASGAVVV